MSIAEFGLNMPDHIGVFISRAGRSLRRFAVPGVVLCVSTLLASCTILPAARPSSQAVVESAKREVDNHAVQVIYVTDATATLFVAQSFSIKGKDVIHISNAPLADFQKLLQAVSQAIYPIAVIQASNIV